MNDRFCISPTSISGLQLVQRRVLGDERGYFERMYCKDELREVLGSQDIVQINHTYTASPGTVRGMHFQLPPNSETKVVSCIRGEVFDVAIDLRKNSKSFLQWHAEVLSEKNHRMLLIPEGFAHGFQTLTGDCEMLYFHTNFYRREAERGLNAQDPRLAIKWPLMVTSISTRDREHPMLNQIYKEVGI